MPSCVDTHIRPNQAVVANTDFSNIEHRTIIVGMEIVAHVDVLSEVAVEVVTHKGIAAHGTEQIFHDFLFLRKISQSQAVQLLDQFRSPGHQHQLVLSDLCTAKCNLLHQFIISVACRQRKHYQQSFLTECKCGVRDNSQFRSRLFSVSPDIPTSLGTP